jgi:uncharacterized protein YerC
MNIEKARARLERQTQAVELLREGFRFTEVGKLTGYNTSMISAIARQNGIKSRGRGRPRGIQDPKRAQDMVRLLREGLTYKEVAAQYKLSRQRVEQLARTMGYSKHAEWRKEEEWPST